jgi:hypothetical protein
MKGADAFKKIDVSGLQRTPQGIYRVTVSPTDVFKPVSRFVNILASGALALQLAIDRGCGPAQQVGPNKFQGTLVFDTGLPVAEVPARLYNVCFAGKGTLLAQVRSDAQGKFLFSCGHAGVVLGQSAS